MTTRAKWCDLLDDDQPRDKLDSILYEKFLKSVNIIEKSFETGAVALSFNGGKENIVLLHLTRYVLKKNHKKIILFNFEEHTFKEIEDFVEQTISRFNLDVIKLKEDGFKACFFKLLELHPEIDHVLMGVRRSDPYCEKSEYFEPTTSGWPKCIRVNPLLDWTYEEIWKFILNLSIPYCRMYDLGYTSIGSVSTTNPNPELLVDGKYLPAFHLKDETLERKGRIKK